MRGWFPSMVLCLAAAAGGCSPQPYVTADRLERGLVLVLTGIEGRSVLNEDICRGLDQGRVNWAIELVDWTTRVPGAYLINLRDRVRNRRQADQIAQRIVRYQMSYPGRPVVLIGQSGGGAIAIWAAEALPPGATIDGIVLLAVALSPGYRLDPALRRCRRGIVSFYSEKDWIFLWAGTTVWGTMDGKHTSAAGRVGFEVPEQPQAAALYKKLFEVPLHKRQDQPSYIDPHIASSSRRFVARYVAPLILAEKWDPSVVGRRLVGEAGVPPAGGR